MYLTVDDYSHYRGVSELYELKEVKFIGTPYEAETPADKLNKIEARGSLSAKALVYRHYNEGGKWDESWNNRSYYVDIKKINGEWQVINKDKYTLPDCSNLPQLLLQVLNNYLCPSD